MIKPKYCVVDIKPTDNESLYCFEQPVLWYDTEEEAINEYVKSLSKYDYNSFNNRTILKSFIYE